MLKLSEAIRLGAMLHPQTFGTEVDWFVDLRDGSLHVAATCAMGAAKQAGYHQVVNGLPWAVCPDGCSVGVRPLERMVIHLNDRHKWTREAIADYVEGIERRQEQKTAAEPVCVAG